MLLDLDYLKYCQFVFFTKPVIMIVVIVDVLYFYEIGMIVIIIVVFCFFSELIGIM